MRGEENVLVWFCMWNCFYFPCSNILERRKQMIIKIPLLCRSKKNSQQMFFRSDKRRPTIIQSNLYMQFERECGYYLNEYREHIEYPINLKCTFYVPDKRKRDIVNLLNAIQDILVLYDVIADDNYNIVQSIDGTRIIYEKRSRRNNY